MAIKVSQQKSNKSSTILYFHAKLKSGEKKAKITCLDTEKNYDAITVELDELPNFPKVGQNSTIEHCNVIYDTDKDQVLAINPWRGVFEAVGIDVGPRPEGGADPIASVNEKIGLDKKPYLERKFYFAYKITDKTEADGFFFGTTPRQYLQDKFFERPDGMTDIAGTPKSTWTNRLKDAVLEQHLGDEDIPWPEDGNVLPALLERLEEIPAKERKVRLTFKDGWIDSVMSLGNGKVKHVVVDDDDDEPDFMKEPVKPVKASGNGKKSTPAVKKIKKVKVAADGDDDL